MSPAGWKALEQWGEGAARIERLVGGVANDAGETGKWAKVIRGANLKPV